MAEIASPFDKDEDETLLDDKRKNYRDYETSYCKRQWPVIITGIGVIALICMGIVIGAVFSTDQTSDRHTREENFPYKNIRLPKNVIPVKYRIYLHPNITDNKFGFTGNVRILVNVLNKTSTILLHSKDLNILDLQLYANDLAFDPSAKNMANAKRISTQDVQHSKKLEMLYISLQENEMLDIGEYVVVIKFKGSLSGGLEGFYKSSYTNKKGEKRYLATTHFEATHARAAFPCFDEPAMKAKFTVIMVREEQHVALSNMPVNKTEPRVDGLRTDFFQESVIMSTYLVAFVVCDYTSVNATTKKNKIDVKIWAPRDQIEQAEFAKLVAPNVLDYYEEFFKVDFPLPKQDLIAIPDFGAGAMENWGLITYRLTSILYDEKESSSANKQWVAVVIAHELAHQWFGNLVTMKWWNDLWLNEGFAAFVEFIGSNHYDESWKMMDQFIVDDVQSSLTLDSHANSHPISVPVKDPAAINEIFDTISYDKGASIIRMMKNFIGTEAFHTGLTDYLNKYKFKNAESDDLWACLTNAAKGSHLNIKSIMDTWTKQMGYPVLKATRNDKDEVTITQTHFLIDKDAKLPKSKFSYKWDVPVTFFTDNNANSTLQWFYKDNATATIKLPKDAKWFKLNKDQIGFYRVNYDQKTWKALKEQLLKDHLKLSQSDRSNLMDDAFELARAEQLSQIEALDLTEYLSKEKEYVPWITALASISYIGEMLRGRNGYDDYEKYMRGQVRPLVDLLGWKDEGRHLQRYLRGSALRTAVARKDTKAVAKAKELFKEFMEKNTTIAPNLRSAIYLGGIKYGGKKEWDFMFKRYRSTPYPSEQRKVMFALTDTQDKNILQKYLKMSLDNDYIRSQDSCGVIEHISMNPVGADMAYKFVKENWGELYKRYGRTSFDLSRLIKYVFGRFKTKEKYIEAKKFLDDHKNQLGSGKRAAKQALAAINNHINWLAKNEKDVVDWLRAKNKKNNYV